MAYFGVDLKADVPSLRSSETNIGNMFSDIMRTEYSSDFAIFTSGSVRGSGVIPKGYLSMLQLKELLPFPDTLAVLKLPGDLIKQALENAVSMYPTHDGRWPMLSGLKITVDMSRPSGSRVTSVTKSNGDAINDKEGYTLAM